jgi:hypothetical protein
MQRVVNPTAVVAVICCAHGLFRLTYNEYLCRCGAQAAAVAVDAAQPAEELDILAPRALMLNLLLV